MIFEVMSKGYPISRFFPVFLLFLLVGCEQRLQSFEFAIIPPPTDGPSALPHLSAYNNQPMLSWVSPDASAHVLSYATLSANGWSQPAVAATGDNWFVNWADFPSVVKLGNNLIAAHWLQKTAGGPYAYDVKVVIKGS